MIILLLIGFAGIALLDAPKLIKSKSWKELTVFSILFIFAFTISLLQIWGIKFPSPIKGIQYIIKDLLHLNYK